MTRHSAPDPEHKELLATVRRYRRAGYAVAVPASGDRVPAFLEGLRPDIVAERHDDRVVIEIRRADHVSGSNDLVPLAERIEAQPGWRFEFISVAPAREAELGLGPDEMDGLLALGFDKAAFLVCYAQIENMIVFAAKGHRLRRPDRPLIDVSRDLAGLGLISGDSYEAIRRAAAFRNRLVHTPAAAVPDRDDIAVLRNAATQLRTEVLARDAA